MTMAEAGPLGKRLRRLEDGRLLRGEGQFADDLQLDGCLHVALLRSPVGSGRIRALDTSSAKAAAGVSAVFTAADLEVSCRQLAVHLTTPGAVAPERPILAGDRVRFAGEMMAAVVAGSRYQAADAVELLQPEIDSLPAVVTLEDALAEGAPLVHEAVPENLFYLAHRTYGDVDGAFEQAGLIVEGEVTHPRVSAAPIECRGVVAMPDHEGGVVVWTSTQVPHLVAAAVAECLRIGETQVRAVATNKCPEGPYRGVGMVTAVLVHERLMDLIAARLGLDPAHVRRANFVPAARMPYLSVTNHPYESGDYAAALETALQALDYAGARKEQEEARGEGRLVGIGIGSYVEYTGAGSATFEARGMADIPGTDTARVWLEHDGRVHVQTTCPAIGQGLQTTLAQVAAANLGVDFASVVVEQTDTGAVGRGTGSFMSRSSVTAATSTHRAAGLLREEILNAASWRLDQPAERLSIRGSQIVVDGKNVITTLPELATTDESENGA